MKKILSHFIFKRFEKNQKIFSFSKIEKSENFSILAFGNPRYFSDFDISDFDISDFQKPKSTKFLIFRFWKRKIFSEIFQIF